MKQQDHITRQAGFTLVELLLAITLMAMLLAFAYGGLSAATKATTRGQVLLEESGNIRVTHQFVRRQLNQMQALAFNITNDVYQGPVVFEGSSSRIQFVAPMPGYLGHGGPQVQSLEIVSDTDGLKLEFNHQLLQSFDPGSGNEREPIILLEQVEDAGFEFLSVDEFGEPLAWVSVWENPGLLPRAVRLDVTFAENRQSIWPLMITGVRTDAAAWSLNGSNSAYTNAIQNLIQKSVQRPR